MTRLLDASAFQIDDLGLFTIKDGSKLVVSGMCRIQWVSAEGIAPGVVLFVPAGGEPVQVTVTSVEKRAALVGTPARLGQRRIYIAGQIEVDDEPSLQFDDVSQSLGGPPAEDSAVKPVENPPKKGGSQ